MPDSIPDTETYLGDEMIHRQKFKRPEKKREHGSALILATLLALVAVGLSYSTILVSISEVKNSKLVADKTQAFYTAEAGLELGINELRNYTRKAVLGAPFVGIDALFEDASGNAARNRVYVDHDLVHNGRMYGTVNIQYTVIDSSNTHRDIAITVDAYVPGRYARVGNRRVEKYNASARIEKTMRVALKSGRVFDYSYFINNWGWFYGDTIVSNGNVRSNGQFDAGNRRPTINGCPQYDSIKITQDGNKITADLQGYRDDNEDGVKDGSDGGIYSGWDIVGSNRVRGMAADDKNKHDFVDTVPMPNLNDMSLYETLAKTREVDGVVKPSSVRIGKTVLSNAVYGDEEGEKGHLFLLGTKKKPILLDGPVVVKGDLIISGVVKGQGSFYVEGNIYIPRNIEYKKPPKTWVPTSNSEAATEKWIKKNYKKDLLGLFAKEHVVVGDFSNSDWRRYVGSWLGHSLNQSKEDSGTDLIPNTRNGRDGIRNTADDDVLEGDNQWTVERYSQADAEAGAIPEGFSVGDVIPGSGEDIDGDGVYDGTTTLADFDLSKELKKKNWGGNMPKNGYKNYSDLGSMYVNRLDCVLYTNHTLGFRTKTYVDFNGAMISRNESIIYGNYFTMNHDRRLLGGGANNNVTLPKVFGEIQDRAYLEKELMNMTAGSGSSAPLVPPVKKRLLLDPENGDAVGKVLQRIPLSSGQNEGE